MSAFAAVAVASPIAGIAVTHMSGPSDEPQHREFVQAALVTDLPTELLGALSQGLSQFGINLPTGILGGASASPVVTTPGLGAGLTTPGLTPPGLTAPGLTAPGLTTPGLTAPGLSVPPATATAPGLTAPGLTAPGLTDPGLTVPGLTDPGLTAPGSPHPV